VSVIHSSASGLKHSFADPPYDTYTPSPSPPRPSGWLFGWDGAVIDQPGGGWSSMKWIAGKLGVAHYDPVNKNLRFTKHD
jgi:hypothetical protein